MATIASTVRAWLGGKRVADPAGRIAVRVAEVRDEASGIRSFELVAADGSELPPFTAGAHVELYLGSGLVRPYSICSDPLERGRYLIAVKRTQPSRGGSQAMHERVAAGDVLAIGPPRNHFPLAPQARHHVLVAAGIGITPLLSMARLLQREGGSFALHYFVHDLGNAAFVRDLIAFGDRAFVHAGLAREDATARISQIVRFASEPAGDAHLYVCGPEGFMQSVFAATGAWPAGTVHAEHFHGDAVALARPRGAFRVRLARSRSVVPVTAEQTIAEALESHGHPVTTSCREGVCGSCITRVTAGVCDHRDSFLSPAERAAGQSIMLCVSRSIGPELVLDL